VKQQVGFKFLDYQYKEQMIWGFGKNEYVVNTPYKDDNRVYGDLYSEDDMDKIIAKQDKFKKGIERRKQQELEDKINEERELQLKLKEENLYDFDKNMTPMQRGKLLKILMKKYRYSDDYGIMTRKDYVFKRLQNGFTLNYKEYGNSRTGNKQWYHILEHPKGEYFNEITKTEYDFAQYLLNSGILDNLETA